jgi:hypothetical protein
MAARKKIGGDRSRIGLRSANGAGLQHGADELIERKKGPAPMLTKSNVILSAVTALGLVGGAASPALALYDYDLYGGPHQTWCDVDPNCNGWNRAQARFTLCRQRPGFLVAPQKHRPAHKHGHDADNR